MQKGHLVSNPNGLIFGSLGSVLYCQLGRVPIRGRGLQFLVNSEGSHFANSEGSQSRGVLFFANLEESFFFQSEGSNFRSTLKDLLLPTRKGPNPKRSKCLPIQKGHFSAKAEGSSFFQSKGSKFWLNLKGLLLSTRKRPNAEGYQFLSIRKR